MQVSITTKSILATVISSTMLTGCLWDDPREAAKYVSDSIDREAVVGHLVTLEGLASKTTDGSAITRAAGTQGYQNSVEFIVDTMKKHGYEVTTQAFDFRAWEELAGNAATVDGQVLVSSKQADDGVEADFSVMSYSGSSDGQLNGELAFVTPDFRFDAPDYDSTDGCEATDFVGKDVSGKIAVIQRGGCSFDAKAVNAENAGANAIIVFNQGNDPGRTAVVGGTLGSVTKATIPALGARFDLGQTWYNKSQSNTVLANLTVNVKDEEVVTQNILAQTPMGNTDQVVMLGAHLDSVPEGPGINDNGSGSAGLLEYAITLATLEAPVKNKVRFAWWAAEEAGLVGSEHYTKDLFEPIYNQAQAQILEELGLEDPSQLTPEQVELVEARYTQINKVKLYLNFDMIGSPNYIYGVMDGDLSDTKESPDNAYTGDFKPPYGTSDIESIFQEFFTEKDLATIPQALSKRSDYAGFADWGIAFGGLFTGAEKVKTAEEAEKFGGDIDVSYDKCYHQSCDDVNNVSQAALYTNTQSLAYVTTYYAFSEPLFPEPATQAAVKTMRAFSDAQPKQKLRIGERLKAADSVSDHDHFHGDFDQDIK
ncbi:M28 family metallopeptidase [Vibrio ostreicida]|uniref:M20/M25/M40 family metallo-hydrolase n=1 Tax=Vibrio ostreicida TaxID=526588 RepID=A0ABT8C250_9VIBR|nr:M28 family metallopeptidase [Vibrio ostreicida]MDN3612445.1 M20/M25/M40 family metallo-hydrolase [Vibrio ostreicida]NPD10158.1 M20/M25/M40 family metallo-hydrolase [Vibrio ostreicida]